MKKSKLLAVLCLALLIVVALVACNQGNQSEQGNCLVRFIDDSDGQTVKEMTVDAGYALTEADIPAAPVHTGQRFVGWYLADKDTQVTAGYVVDTAKTFIFAEYEATEPAPGPGGDEDVQVTAVFTLGEYDGEGSAPAAQTVTKGSIVTLPAVGVEWEGHAFDGWLAGGVVRNAGAGVTLEENTTFVAQWHVIPTATTYTVHFDMGENSGAQAPNDIVVSEGGSAELPSVANWPGHNFLGWQIEGDSALHQPEESYPVTESVTFVAQWDWIDYTISFDLGVYNGSGLTAPAEQTGHLNQTITLPGALSWAEHTFKGWKNSQTGNTYDAGGAYNVMGSATLVAQWESDYAVSDLEGVWLNAGSQAYAIIEATDGGKLHVKGYVNGSYGKIDSEEVTYDKSVGQFTITIKKDYGGTQTETRTYVIRDHQLHISGTGTLETTLTKQTDESLSGKYFYHDNTDGDEFIEVTTGGVIVDMKAKVFESNTNVPVFAAIVKEDESYKLTYKMGSSSGYNDLGVDSFAVLESGHLWIKCAYGSGTYKLFVKGATAGVTYSGPDGASLYKYTVDGGYVYTVKERSLGENLLATVEGDVEDGQIFTLNYTNGSGETSKVCKLTGDTFAYASAERGSYEGESGTLVLDGFGGGTLAGESITYSGYSTQSQSVVIDGNNYKLDLTQKSYTIEKGADKWMGRVYTYQSGSSTYTLTFDGFGNATRTIVGKDSDNNYTYEFSEDESKVTFSDSRNSYDSVVLYHGFVIRYAMYGGVTGDNYEMAATIDSAAVGYYTLADGKLLNVTKWYFAISSADGDEQYTTEFTENEDHTQYDFTIGGTSYSLTIADGVASVDGAQVSKATFFTNDTYYAEHNKVEVGVNDLDVTFKYFGGSSDSLSAYYMAYEDGNLTYTAYGKQSSYEGTYKFTVESGELYLTATSGENVFDIDHAKLGSKEADLEFVYGEYHMTGSDITLTYTLSNGSKSIILSGGEHDGTFTITSPYSGSDYITVNSVKLIWEIWGSTLQLRCQSTYDSSEYAGEYTLDHTIEPDIYPERWFGLWVSSDGSIKIKVDAKNLYIWGPEDEDWVSTTMDSGSGTDFYVMYKGNRVNVYGSSDMYLTGTPFTRTTLTRSVFGDEMVGYFKTADEQYVTISVKGLVYRHGESIGAATDIEEQGDNDYTFAFGGENYRIWKDGETLKLSKQDGANEQELTEAQPDNTKARFVLTTNTTNHIEFDGCGNFLQSAYADNKSATTGYYIVNSVGNYVVSGTGNSSYDGEWVASQNGNVITKGSTVYEKDATINVTLGTYIGNDIVLIISKWSVSASTPTHNDFEETYDITVLDDGGYQFTIGGQQHTLSGYNNTLSLDGNALEHVTTVPLPGGTSYANHNIIKIVSRSIDDNSETAQYVGSELIYSATVSGKPYDFKVEHADEGDKYFVRPDGEEQWYELSENGEQNIAYPYGVWKRESDDKQITITGQTGSKVAYTFAVDGGSTATTSATWVYGGESSSSNNKQFTVEIDGVTYTVAGYGSILLITSEDGPNDLDGIYDFDSAVDIEYFTDEWLGTWATADGTHTINITDLRTLKYKNVADEQFYDTVIEVYSTSYNDRYNITIQGGENNGKKWIVRYDSSSKTMYFGESSTSANTQMFRTIFPNEWVGNYKTEDGQYVNISRGSISYAANYHSELVAMSGYTETSTTDFFVTIGEQEYRIWNDGTLKFSVKDDDGSAKQLTQRDADFMAGKFVDPSYPTRYYLIFDGFGNVFVHNNSSECNGTYYFDEEYTTITIVAEYKDGTYTLSNKNRTMQKGTYGDKFVLESPFSDIQGTYIGENVLVVIDEYSITISTNTFEAQVVEEIQALESEFHFSANGSEYVLTNSGGALELNGTPLAKLSTLGKFYANDNDYIVVFKDGKISVNDTDSSELSVAFVDGKLTFTFTVSKQQYTITKEGDAYKLSVGGSQYDMSTVPVSPATIFGTWTKDDVTWTFDYQADRATTSVYLTVTGGANAGVYDVKNTYDTKGVTRQIEINSVQYTAKITKQTLTVTSDGENEYNGDYTKTATTEPDIVSSNFVGVWLKKLGSIDCVMIITTKHMWIRPQAQKGGQFEDFYDLVPNSSSSTRNPDYTKYTDVQVFWVSSGGINIWGNVHDGTKVEGCSATSPEEYLLWESSQEG